MSGCRQKKSLDLSASFLPSTGSQLEFVMSARIILLTTRIVESEPMIKCQSAEFSVPNSENVHYYLEKWQFSKVNINGRSISTKSQSSFGTHAE